MAPYTTHARPSPISIACSAPTVYEAHWAPLEGPPLALDGIAASSSAGCTAARLRDRSEVDTDRDGPDGCPAFWDRLADRFFRLDLREDEPLDLAEAASICRWALEWRGSIVDV